MPSSIRELDRAHHIHPFNNIRQLKAEGVLVIDRAEGVYVYDADGRRYLDGMAGLWCVNAGYGRRELVAAAERQMTALPYYNTFFQSTTAPAARLAARLADLAPQGIDHVFFANSGSEANDTIVRLARIYWEAVGRPAKKAIISRTGSYHGSTQVGASLCGLDYMHPTDDLPLPGFHHIAGPYPYRERGEDTAEAYGLRAARRLEAKILELGPENVGLFHADTIAAGGGVIVPPPGYWPEVARICREHDVLLSIDEVITGFGRAGAWFSSSLYDLTPDFIAAAKGLSSGYAPISATLVGDRVMKALLDSGLDLNHGFTYSGHPTAAAVALENIRLLDEERLVERAAGEKGTYFQRRLNELADHPLVGDVRGRGLLAGVELVADKASHRAFDPPGIAGKRCFAICLEEGLITRPLNDTMAFSPPLTITREGIDELVSVFNRGLDRVQNALRL